MQKVSIILVNYNGIAFNTLCIKSILDQTYKNYEIIFVNNMSTDGSLEEVKNIFSKEIDEKKLVIVNPGYNSGFAQGNNIGVNSSDPYSEYICLLNNDTIVDQNRLQHMVEGIESDLKLGVVGGMIYDQGYEKDIHNLFFVQYKKGINNYFFDSVIVDQTPQDIAGYIIYTTGVSGCCLLYKKDLLDKPFDDIYFAYMEDTALCMKILLQGYRVGLVKKAIVHHLGSGSFGKKPNVFKVFQGQKNYILNFILFSQGYMWIGVLPFFILGIMIRTLINYPLVRLQGLYKAIIWIIKKKAHIGKIKKQIVVEIKTKNFYQQLGKDFMSIPYYTSTPKILHYILKILNIISTRYYQSIFKL